MWRATKKVPERAEREFYIGGDLGKGNEREYGQEAQPTKITPSTSNTVVLASACVRARTTDATPVRVVVSGGRCLYGTHVLIRSRILMSMTLDEDFELNVNITSRIPGLKIGSDVNITSQTCGMIYCKLRS